MRGGWRALSGKCFLVAVGIGLVGPTAAPLGAEDQRVELGAFIGSLSLTYDLGSVSNIFFVTTGEADDVSFGGLYGFRAAYNFSPHIAVEGTYSRADATFLFAVDDEELGAVALGDQFDARLQNFSGAAVVQFPLESGLVPYGAIGFGLQLADPKEEIFGLDSTTGTGLNFGGGIKYFAPSVPWLGARFDIRFQRVSEGLAFEGTSEPRGFELTIGAAVRF